MCRSARTKKIRYNRKKCRERPVCRSADTKQNYVKNVGNDLRVVPPVQNKIMYKRRKRRERPMCRSLHDMIENCNRGRFLSSPVIFYYLYF